MLHLWPNSLSLGQGRSDVIKSSGVIEFDDRVAPLTGNVGKKVEGGVSDLGVVRFAPTSFCCEVP